MAQVLPSPRASWTSPRDLPQSSCSPSRDTHFIEDEEMDDICGAMEQLLHRGDKYQAPAGLRHIALKETWYWVNSKGSQVRYLDASCLLFGDRRNCLEVVDYANKASTHNVGYYAAVRHSGDMLCEEDCKGDHTIDVDLASLAPHVRELYITISAFTPCALSDIAQPCISIVNRDTTEALCSYELEEQASEVLAQYTSVTMCRIYRSLQNADVWEVEALGQLGKGSAGSYAPIVDYITNTLPLANSLADLNWGM